MSCGQGFGGLSEDTYWYLNPSLGPGDIFFVKEDSRKKSITIEPDEMLDLDASIGSDMELATPAGAVHTGNTFRKHHTMPELRTPLGYRDANLHSSAPSVSSNPKRSATTEEIHIARSQQRINSLLHRIEQGTPSTSQNTQLAETNSVEQPHSIDDYTGEEWSVPTFLLEQPINGNHYGDLTLGNSDSFQVHPQRIGNSQGSFVTEPEHLSSVPFFNHFIHFGEAKTGLSYPAPPSDSGIGSSMMSANWSPPSNSSHYSTPTRWSPQKRRDDISSQESFAKGSASHKRTSVSVPTATGKYQQHAAQLQAAPLTSAIAPTSAPTAETQPMLSESALATIKGIILEPILTENDFRNFWYICEAAKEQAETGKIVTLRDLEKFLFHKAGSNIQDSQAYNSFCMEILSRVKMSLKHMPKNELKRCYDPPYDSGYFLDMMAQFNSSAVIPTRVGVSMESGELESDVARFVDDKHPLLDKRPAEPRPEVDHSKRQKLKIALNEADTITSNTPVYTTPQSTMRTIPPLTSRRSDRRGGQRKAPQKKKQQEFPCLWPDCLVEAFTRQCDLTKHEKTHTRPHKCPCNGCPYATEGFPNEKERDRHWFDKHSSSPPGFKCEYSPCSYSSRRESNCKQHMEKAHGYIYKRAKQNYKKNGVKRPSNLQTSQTVHRRTTDCATIQNIVGDPAHQPVVAYNYHTSGLSSQSPPVGRVGGYHVEEPLRSTIQPDAFDLTHDQNILMGNPHPYIDPSLVDGRRDYIDPVSLDIDPSLTQYYP